MFPFRKNFPRITAKTFDGHHSTAGEKVRVSFSDADDIISKSNEKIVASQVNLDKLPSPSQNIEDLLLQTTQVESGAPTGGRRSYRPSSRIEILAKPLARWRKPSIRLRYVFRKVDHQIPWSKKGPNDKKLQVVIPQPPPLPPRTKAGVSRAALKYEATEHIKQLAKHRPKQKPVDENKCFSVKPSTLLYKASLRIQQLSKPRIRKVKT